MDTHGLQAVTWAMLLLYYQDCKAWCHMVMGQRYNDHFSSSYAPISMPRGLRKVGCQGQLCKSVTTQERGAGSNRLPFLKAHS